MWHIHMVECYLALKMNYILLYSPAWGDLENVLIEISQSQNERLFFFCFQLYEVPTIVKFMEKECGRVGITGRGEGRMGSYC